MVQHVVVGPQEGPQEQFLASPADIVIFGGSAGGGKSYGLLLESLRHSGRRGFNGVLFRRTTVDLRNQGGLWSESQGMFRHVAGRPRETPILEWKFPAGAVIQMAHLEHEKTKFNHQGAQYAFIGFDELTQFTEGQFWYLVSRNRSVCGVRPYVRCTTNPDADSWVATFIAWWINQDTGYPIPERGGVLRWFVRVNDTLIWGNSPAELAEYEDDEGRPIPPKSVTFIPSSLDDNKLLTKMDPGYRANLLALGTVDRERLLKGNWKIRPAAGLYFQRTWCEVVDVAPANMRLVRGWDLAATLPRPGTDPDWTTGTKIGQMPGGQFCVVHHAYDRLAPAGVEAMVHKVATDDGRQVQIEIPQDPGQAGKSQAAAMARKLAGWNVRFRPVTGSKLDRFKPFSAQAEAGNVLVVRGDWNERWFRELENFPPTGNGHDDDADSTAQAFDPFVRGAPVPAVTGYRSVS